jgi:hypothetical protein
VIVALLREFRAAHDAAFAIKRVAVLEARLAQQTYG